MTNFNLIEGNHDSPELIRRFIELYNDSSVRVVDMCKRLDRGQYKYKRIKLELAEKGLIDLSTRERKPPRYITYNKHNKTWVVFKSINKRSVAFTSFKEESDALKAVELFKKYGWDKKNCAKIRREVMGL